FKSNTMRIQHFYSPLFNQKQDTIYKSLDKSIKEGFMKLSAIILVSASLMLFPLISSADKPTPGEMNKVCLEGFLKDSSKSSDPDAYKSYVNKLCDCSETKVVG